MIFRKLLMLISVLVLSSLWLSSIIAATSENMVKNPLKEPIFCNVNNEVVKIEPGQSKAVRADVDSQYPCYSITEMRKAACEQSSLCCDASGDCPPDFHTPDAPPPPQSLSSDDTNMARMQSRSALKIKLPKIHWPSITPSCAIKIVAKAGGTVDCSK